ncbi:MAG: TonB-dependent receptor [Tannerella sp.]|jgi:TonB-linked SusC/RagA family outer membrane protein|nr:TonB-dependent receptor [Tannerella sp.]
MKINTKKLFLLQSFFTCLCIFLLFSPLTAGAQKTENKQTGITGTVLDEDGIPIIGANIIEKGTTNGVITDMDGKFLIQVADKATLRITYIGYLPQEITIKSQGDLKITLKEDTQNLDEVVVVGFGTQKKVNLTGAVSSIKVDEVVGHRPVTSMSSALQGAIPGLQVTVGNASPGGSPTLNIRGTNSINGGAPLVLVDNMPMDINMVDPNDIETVNVLKDAAASAVYGARAAFGVILITTKQAKKGDKVKLDYSGNFALSNPYNIPKVASAFDLVKGYQDAGQTSDPTMGADVEKWLVLLEKYKQNPSAYPEGYYIDELGTKYYLQEHDQIDDMTDKFGFQQKHNLSMSGSTEKTNYRLSFGILDEDGILYTNKDSYRRYNLSAFVSSEITKWLTIQADIKYADTKNTWVSDGIRGGIWARAIVSPSYFPIEGQTINGVYYMPETSRSALLQLDPVKRKQYNLRTLGRFILNPLPGLTVTGEYAFTREGFNRNLYNKIVYYADAVGVVMQSYQNSKYEITQNNTINHALNLFANYTKDFENHSVSVMGGYNQEDDDYEQTVMSRLDMINGELPSISQGTGEKGVSDSYIQYATRSLFYRLNYSYAGKYLFETNGRYDGSSKFPKDSRFGFFPSMSLGWRISEESFMEWSKKYLSNLKLRYSIGEIGNQSISPYAFVPGMDAYLSSWLVGNSKITSLKPPALVSNNFTWETVRTYNYGLDLGLFKQKLDATFNYYIRNTLDMLAPGMELPSVVGADAPEENVADLQTKGWELSVNWQDKIENVGYRIGFNLYDSRTKITKFDNEVGLLSSHYAGKEIGEIWGYETDRFYTVNDFDENGKVKPGIPVVEAVTPKPGDILYVDQNDDGIINKGKNTTNDPGDMKIIGNNSKRFQYGITAGASYKGFDLSLFMQGVGKRDLWRSDDLTFPYFSEFSTMYKHQLDYWTPENTNAFYPRLYERATGNTGANRNIQTKYILNGAYIRLKNVTLSYTLPVNWYKKYSVDRVNVFFSGEDLWTHYNTPKGIDPETDPMGRGWAYPNMRKISFGINITL